MLRLVVAGGLLPSLAGAADTAAPSAVESVVTPPPAVPSTLDTTRYDPCRYRPAFTGGLRFGSALGADLAVGGVIPVCEREYGPTSFVGLLALGALGARGYELSGGAVVGGMVGLPSLVRVPIGGVSVGASLLHQVRDWQMERDVVTRWGAYVSLTWFLTARVAYYPKASSEPAVTGSLGVGF